MRVNWDLQRTESKLDTYAMLETVVDSEECLLQAPELCCLQNVEILKSRCLDLELVGKFSTMEHWAHQTVLLQFLLNLSNAYDSVPTSSFIESFFSK